jgi:hypothetical protein
LPPDAIANAPAMPNGVSMKLAAVLLALPALAHAGGGYYDAPPQASASNDGDAFVFAAPSLGLGAPLGLFGIEFGVGLDAFRLSGGAGIGLRGVQIGATGRAFTRAGSTSASVSASRAAQPGSSRTSRSPRIHNPSPRSRPAPSGEISSSPSRCRSRATRSRGSPPA